VKWAGILDVRDGKVKADDAECINAAVIGEETSRELLFRLGHAYGLFGKIADDGRSFQQQ